jgi:hypothetical protein
LTFRKAAADSFARGRARSRQNLTGTSTPRVAELASSLAFGNSILASAEAALSAEAGPTRLPLTRDDACTARLVLVIRARQSSSRFRRKRGAGGTTPRWWRIVGVQVNRLRGCIARTPGAKISRRPRTAATAATLSRKRTGSRASAGGRNQERDGHQSETTARVRSIHCLTSSRRKAGATRIARMTPQEASGNASDAASRDCRESYPLLPLVASSRSSARTAEWRFIASLPTSPLPRTPSDNRMPRNSQHESLHGPKVSVPSNR